MNPLSRRTVADANVLLAALLGGRAEAILQPPEVEELFATEMTFAEVQEYAVVLGRKKLLSLDTLLLAMAALPVSIVEQSVYPPAIPQARNDTSRQVLDGITSKRETLDTPKRQPRSMAEKRRIVQETLTEGASVASLTFLNSGRGIEPDILFRRNSLDLEGRLNASPNQFSSKQVSSIYSGYAICGYFGSDALGTSKANRYAKPSPCFLKEEGKQKRPAPSQTPYSPIPSWI